MPTIEVEIDSDIIQSSTSQFSETNDDDGVYWQNKKNRMMDMEVHVLGEEVQDINTLPGCSLQGLTMPTTPELAPAPAKKIKPEQSLEDLKKELVKKEIEKVTKQIEQDQEKHAVELEILKLKRDL
ncbi:unnamed protein product [Arctia plantaginis]|uniref:Uncharacterized protein n=1 Tax=Arctia plantaginis TaxID=874455 RepID=A0A8S0ZG24_ARCPL|nr:unnamed protein product [Arctia plantaginis]